MNPEERERLTEKWLEAALEQHRSVEPRPGLESRILTAVAAKRAQAGSASWLHAISWPRLAAVVAAAAMLFVGFYMTYRPAAHQAPQSPLAVHHEATQPPSSERAQMAHSPSPSSASSAKTSASSAVRLSARGAKAFAHRTPSPRLAQFPAPTPLSDQEQLLLRYLRQTPPEEIVAVVRDNEQLQQERLRELEASPQRTPAP